jgi:hypothetical protein
VIVLQRFDDDLALAIDGKHDVMSAKLVAGIVPRIGPSPGVGPGRGQQTGKGPRPGAFRQPNLAALRDPDLVRTLGPDTRARTSRPPVV